MKIYFDACALNRLTDDSEQARVLREADAVTAIIKLVTEGAIEWQASEALATELMRNPNEDKLLDAIGLLDRAGPRTPLRDSTETRAQELAALGYGYFDALHLAFAEETAVDALLTTDDRFLRKAARGLGNPSIRVMNPLDWLQEAQTWLQHKK